MLPLVKKLLLVPVFGALVLATGGCRVEVDDDDDLEDAVDEIEDAFD
jgi:hypothetical protein